MIDLPPEATSTVQGDHWLSPKAVSVVVENAVPKKSNFRPEDWLRLACHTLNQDRGGSYTDFHLQLSNLLQLEEQAQRTVDLFAKTQALLVTEALQSSAKISQAKTRLAMIPEGGIAIYIMGPPGKKRFVSFQCFETGNVVVLKSDRSEGGGSPKVEDMQISQLADEVLKVEGFLHL